MLTTEPVHIHINGRNIGSTMRKREAPLPLFPAERMNSNTIYSQNQSAVPGLKKSGVYFDGIEIPLNMMGTNFNPNSFLPANMTPSQTFRLRAGHRLPVIAGAITIPNSNECFLQRPLHAKPSLPTPNEIMISPPGSPDKMLTSNGGVKRTRSMSGDCDISAMSHFDHGVHIKIEEENEGSHKISPEDHPVRMRAVKEEDNEKQTEELLPARKTRKISHDDLDAAMTLSTCFKSSDAQES